MSWGNKSDHPVEREYRDLNISETEAYREADVILALDVWSYNYVLKDTDPITHELYEAIEDDFKLIDIGLREHEISNLFPNYYAQRELESRLLRTRHRRFHNSGMPYWNGLTNATTVGRWPTSGSMN